MTVKFPTAVATWDDKHRPSATGDVRVERLGSDALRIYIHIDSAGAAQVIDIPCSGVQYAAMILHAAARLCAEVIEAPKTWTKPDPEKAP